MTDTFRNLLEEMVRSGSEAPERWRAFSEFLSDDLAGFCRAMSEHLSEEELVGLLGMLLFPLAALGMRSPSRRVALFRAGQALGLHVLAVQAQSPVPNTFELDERDFEVHPGLANLLGFDAEEQLALVDRIALFADETRDIPEEEPSPGELFRGNRLFGELDLLCYHCLVRSTRPRRIVEIGGGYSTLVAARAAALNGDTAVTCVDPHPRIELGAGTSVAIDLHRVPVQELPHSFFEQLESGDILFVDSSHVSRIGSDVNYLILDVLPHLADGVLVHFHDVFLPCEYPREWIDGLAFLNEQYVLGAFLLFNERFDVLLVNSHLARNHLARLERAFGCSFGVPPHVEPASLWMVKRPAPANGG